jgi:DNA-binding PadR family transcriptional regulator
MLMPIEEAILGAGLEAVRGGTREFHGFAIAKAIQTQQEARRLTAHGTLYKALARMEGAGLLESHWEDPAVAAEENRPRRRLYQVTALGEAALARAHVGRSEPSAGWRPGIASP